MLKFSSGWSGGIYFKLGQPIKQRHRCLVALLPMSFFCLAITESIQAQIVPDTTVNTIVIPQGNTSIITGGTTAGSNLFHSFQQFSIPKGSEARFDNNLNIQNIFTRVTGSSISNIDGLIRANGTANLFLLNPNGIIFGPNAQLNIGGSFIATTANSLNFADGTRFSATDYQTTPLLTISVPIGLQFGATAERICNQSRVIGIDRIGGNIITAGLMVDPGQTLALVGGNIALEKGGSLTAPDGRIELGSVAGSSLVSLNQTPQGWVMGYQGVQNFQDIEMSQNSVIRASGLGGGNIQIQGKQVTLSDRSSIELLTQGNQNGGEIFIRSEQLNIQNSSLVDASTQSSGKGGNVTIQTGRLVIRDGLQVVAGADKGTGSGGDLNVTATDFIELIGIGTLANGSEIPSGLSTTTESAGNAGNLRITTPRLLLQDGAQITASTFGTGNGGNVTIIASEVEVIGISPNRRNVSAILAQVEPMGSGTGGSLTIETATLLVRDGGQVGTGTFGAGKGGNLNVTATESIELSGTAISADNQVRSSGLFTSTRGAKEGGNLTINTGELIVRDGARVSVVSTGAGNAGTLNIKADSILLNNQGNLSGSTLSREGGSINIETENLQLRRNSNIVASAGIQEGSGNGGNVTIGTQTLVALENSDIRANAFTGDGGRVNITARGIFGTEFRDRQTLQSDITASSTFGRQGEVIINTPDVDPSSGLIDLSQTFIDRSRQIAQGCPTDKSSRFTVTGRGGLPPNPGESLRTDGTVVNWVTLEPGKESYLEPVSYNPATRSMPDQIVEAQGWVRGANGEIVLTASAPSVTPYGSRSNVPTCGGF